MPDFLAAYPPWFVAVFLTLAAAAAIWIFSRILRLALWLLLLAVLAGGTAWVAWILVRGSG